MAWRGSVQLANRAAGYPSIVPLTPGPSPTRGEGERKFALPPSPLVGEGPGVRGQNGVRGEPPHDSANGTDPRQATLRDLEKAIITDLPDGLRPGVLAGEPVMVAEGFALLEEDGRRLGTWTTLLLGPDDPDLLSQPALAARARSSSCSGRCSSRGPCSSLSGLQLSMVSSMLTAIVTVVGVATVMHLIVDFRELRSAGPARSDAALHKPACCWPGRSSAPILTDVAGFGSLWWASVEPVRDFGTMMVVGSLLVIPAICLLVPALRPAFGRRDSPSPSPAGAKCQLGHWLMRSVDAIQARPKTVAVVTLAIFAPCRRSARCAWRSKPISPAISAAAARSSRPTNSSKRGSAARASGTS